MTGVNDVKNAVAVHDLEPAALVVRQQFCELCNGPILGGVAISKPTFQHNRMRHARPQLVTRSGNRRYHSRGLALDPQLSTQINTTCKPQMGTVALATNFSYLPVFS